jgi:hypothetical protein
MRFIRKYTSPSSSVGSYALKTNDSVFIEKRRPVGNVEKTNRKPIFYVVLVLLISP